MLKRWIPPLIAHKLLYPSRYFAVSIVGMIKVKYQDLHVYPHLRYVHFADDYRSIIDVPGYVTHLQLPHQWNLPLEHGMLPDNLESLIFGDSFNQPIEPGMLPSSIRQLVIGEAFDRPLVVGSLPVSLVHVSIRSSSAHRIEPGPFPPSLRSLSLIGWRGGVEAGLIPEHLQHLVMPMSESYNPAFVPDSLESLHTYTIYSPLPRSLTHLTIESRLSLYRVEEDFPDSLTHLVIAFSADEGHDAPEYRTLEYDFPWSITHLAVGHRVPRGDIPDSVTHLKLTKTFRSELKTDTIPSSFTHLTFGPGFNQQLLPGVIPSSVKVLDLGGFDKPLSLGVIPNSVDELTFGKDFSQVIGLLVIPPSVKKLKFMGPFRQPLIQADSVASHPESWFCHLCPDHCQPVRVTIGSIPLSVTELQCCWPPNVDVPIGAIPMSVTKLTLGRPVDDFNALYISPVVQRLVPGSIPSSVIELDMGHGFCGDIGDGVIPDSIKLVKLGMWYSNPLPV